MLKKDVTCVDFDGVQRTHEMYFHLTKAELVEFVAGYPEDFKAYVLEIMEDVNKTRFVALFRRLIMMSYGKREGSRFLKTPEMAEEFTHTEPYSELFLEIFSNKDKMIAFFNGVLGVDIEKLVAELNS